MTKSPLLGAKSPHFELKDIKGVIYRESDLKGKPAVLIFLSNRVDETNLHLLHNLRDMMEVFNKAEALVIVIISLSIKDINKLIVDHKLNFPILNDSSGEIYRSFGLVGQTSIIESTVILDPQNYVAWVERPIKHESHLKRILKVIKEHAPKNVVIPDIFDEHEKLIQRKLKKELP